MSLSSRVQALTVTPLLIESGIAEGKMVFLRNPTATVYIGGDTSLSAANGFPLGTTDVMTLTLLPGDQLYMMTAATANVNVLVSRDNTH